MLRPVDNPGLPRLLHPVAWWAWALCLAAAVSRTTNPFLIALVVVVAAYAVSARRELNTPSIFLTFLGVAVFVITLRVLAQILLGGGVGGRTVLFTLPELPLPDWFGRTRLGGAVTLEEVLAAAYDGARLAGVIVCVGAANALASPRRLLRLVPATLYEIGTALVVALAYAPQLVDDARRVRTARRLRGHSGRSMRELGRIAVPVLENSLERALELAAAMESRGYGRSVHRSTAGRRRAATLTLVGVGGVVAGVYGLLDGGSPPLLTLPLLAVGVLASGAALLTGARRDPRSRYRPDPWALPEWGVVATGVVAVAVVVAAAQAGLAGIVPPSSPARIPQVPWQVVLGIAVALGAAFVAPEPPQRAALAAARTRAVAGPDDATSPTAPTHAQRGAA